MSAIHGLPVTLRIFRVKSDKFDRFRSQSIVFTKLFKNGMSLDLARRPEVAILGADQKERGLWGREWQFLVLIERSAASVDESILDYAVRLGI